MTVDKYQVSLKVFVKNKNDEILILQNSDTWGNGDYFDVPGGRIDEDEFDIHNETILRREIGEELGEDIKVNISLKPVAISRLQNTRDRVFLVFFEAEYISGSIRLSEEHKSYKWVKLDEIDLEQRFLSGMLKGVKNYLKYN